MIDRRRLMARGAALAAPIAASWSAWVHAAGALESDEGVVVLPSTARWLDDDRIELRVQAWVYERESRRIASRALTRLIGLDLDELNADDRVRFAERTRLFAREAQARRRLQLHVRGAMPPIDLPRSARDGGIDAAVIVPRSAVDAAAAGNAAAANVVSGGVAFELAAGPRRFAGRAYVRGSEGLSIVSDVDDTIKHTQVRQRRQMLLNTFARPFAAVPGMQAWYAQIAREGAAAFHYVSSGPWAMAPAIEGFLGDNTFPAGSLHMRSFSLAPQSLMSKSASAAHKRDTIERLLADQPARRFVLVGDSGEQDPEIYGALARRHPGRIAAILVRDVTGDAADGARHRAAFAGVARARWSLFDDPSRLPLSWR